MDMAFTAQGVYTFVCLQPGTNSSEVPSLVAHKSTHFWAHTWSASNKMQFYFWARLPWTNPEVSYYSASIWSKVVLRTLEPSKTSSLCSWICVWHGECFQFFLLWLPQPSRPPGMSVSPSGDPFPGLGMNFSMPLCSTVYLLRHHCGSLVLKTGLLPCSKFSPLHWSWEKGQGPASNGIIPLC